MSQIYSRAYVTIAADGASSCDIGFLEGKRRRYLKLLLLDSWWATLGVLSKVRLVDPYLGINVTDMPIKC